ncbi:2TM domain-containing protein [Nostoc sp. CENA67]|uniref:2TM domain-containing protein n=1 Tax=Amazonocrinis nigriterrae CENA67 TaxID=2794033 RepID=A0A8J7L620_9NOST|nr:2TM domain-containing protein [Amazonocrinis nigriterrae]MBH8561829.1 2TM domain-containing protein [Amazonocrinis nigriterrae CENA67]
MTDFEPKSLRSYSQEDVQRILQLAIARQADDQDKEFSYDQLLEIATELEISVECLNLAERDWRSQQSEIQQRQAFDSYRIGRFKKRLGNYAIVNAGLMLVDFIGGGGLTWSLYILLFWGMAVGLDVWNTFQAKGEEYEMAFQKWYRKHQFKRTVNTVLNKWFKALQI